MPPDSPNQQVSPDVAALVELLGVLDRLDDAGRERVLRFVQDHYQRPTSTQARSSS